MAVELADYAGRLGIDIGAAGINALITLVLPTARMK